MLFLFGFDSPTNLQQGQDRQHLTLTPKTRHVDDVKGQTPNALPAEPLPGHVVLVDDVPLHHEVHRVLVVVPLPELDEHGIRDEVNFQQDVNELHETLVEEHALVLNAEGDAHGTDEDAKAHG